MRNRRALFAAGLLAGGLVTGAAAAPLALERFVAGWPVEAPPQAEFFDLELPADVYGDAGDPRQIAVLDATGEPQSFFVLAPEKPSVLEEGIMLDASPLYAERPRGAVASVTTEERRTAVTVTQAEDESPTVIGFVVDARDVAFAPVAIELDWRELPQPFIVPVQIEQSTDLTDWRRVGGASVAALNIGDSQVRQARVPIAARSGGYLRITAGRGVADWYLVRARLIGTSAEVLPPARASLEPLAPDASPESAEADVLYFDAGGALPVSAVTLDFGATGGFLRADVAASDTLDGPWRTLTVLGLFYDVDFQRQRFTNEPYALGRHSARYWRVSPRSPARGSAPRLVLEYVPDTLRVAARGQTPYLLVAGTLASEAGPDAALASVWSTLRAAAAVPRATIGERRELGGVAALTAPRVFPWRVAALWGLLAAGVLVVALMAFRLAREMHATS
jgi:hypothetical protein